MEFPLEVPKLNLCISVNMCEEVISMLYFVDAFCNDLSLHLPDIFIYIMFTLNNL